ncbi:hypothetical protein [Streptomyces javensis]|uniref:Uncharacterized protein n=1 Tax=Streptomyces javensis TaxID=114698 RepID=A0ABS0RBS8_9ACTN|nr:hypothetical protein [Streptomyces javensis]MBI0314743.1 hypothetical protein [Streptomyces javensis]
MTALRTARDVYAKGTPGEVCIAHNRLVKSIEMAMALYVEFGSEATPAMVDRLTEDDFKRAARTAGVNPPNSEATREQVRLLLKVFVALGTAGDSAAETYKVLFAAPARNKSGLVAFYLPSA